MPISIDVVQAFFLRAMAAGWASDSPPVKIPQLPGFSGAAYTEADLRLLDAYCIGAGGKSAGFTTIWYQNQVIWMMNYSGLYEESEYDFLKEALLNAYTSNCFIGGRGPMLHMAQDQPLVYHNLPNTKSSFERFEGQDRIVDMVTNKPIGWHDYSGQFLGAI